MITRFVTDERTSFLYIDLLKLIEIVTVRPDFAKSGSSDFGEKNRRFDGFWFARHCAPLKLRSFRITTKTTIRSSRDSDRRNLKSKKALHAKASELIIRVLSVPSALASLSDFLSI